MDCSHEIFSVMMVGTEATMAATTTAAWAVAVMSRGKRLVEAHTDASNLSTAIAAARAAVMRVR